MSMTKYQVEYRRLKDGQPVTDWKPYAEPQPTEEAAERLITHQQMLDRSPPVEFHEYRIQPVQAGNRPLVR